MNSKKKETHGATYLEYVYGRYLPAKLYVDLPLWCKVITSQCIMVNKLRVYYSQMPYHLIISILIYYNK